MQLSNGRGILILDHHGFGNVVMSLPLLRAICRWANGRWPVRALFASPQHFELVREEGLDIVPLYLRPRYQGFRGLMRLRADLSGRIDLIVGVPQVPVRIPMLLKLAFGARYSVGEAFPLCRRLLSFSAEKGWTKSILTTQEDMAAFLGIGRPLGAPSIRLTEKELDWSETVLVSGGISQSHPLIGVHCSGAEPSKKWPPEYFGRVISELKLLFPDLAVVSFGVITEKGDTEAARRVAGDVQWVDGVGSWTIRESLALLRRCDLVISGDTGIMHMAAAVGTKTLSIFGPTSPRRLAPKYNGGVTVCPETSCHPCFRHKYIECHCIRYVSPERVLMLANQSMPGIPAGRTYRRLGEGAKGVKVS